MAAEIEAKYLAQRVEFIKMLAKLLPFGDWNDKLLEETSEASGFSKVYHSILFPDGLRMVVDCFETRQDELMMEYLSEIEPPVKIREKIALALKIRIKKCASKIIHVKSSSFYAYPENIAFGAQIALRTVDRIWRYAGDTSTDFNYYTKRGLLLSAYLSAILFYIADTSENFTDTDKFIDEALAKIINIANLKNLIKIPQIEDIPFLRLFS